MPVHSIEPVLPTPMPLLKLKTLKSESLDPSPKLTNINKNSHHLENNILVRNGIDPESTAIKSKDNHNINADASPSTLTT